MQDPEGYERNKKLANSIITETLPSVLEKMEPWKKGELVMDFGCGAGSTAMKYLVPLAEASDSSIHGVDISQKMIDSAQTNYPHPNIKYFCEDILTSKRLEAFTYDRIISILVFHFIPNCREVLEKLFSRMKPGGELAIIAAGSHPIIDGFQRIRNNPIFLPYTKDCSVLMDPVWQNGNEAVLFSREAELAGFNVTYLKVENLEVVLELSTALNFMMAVNPFSSEIPGHLLPELKEAFLQEIFNSCRHYPEANTVKFDQTTLCVLLKKPKNRVLEDG